MKNFIEMDYLLEAFPEVPETELKRSWLTYSAQSGFRCVPVNDYTVMGFHKYRDDIAKHGFTTLNEYSAAMAYDLEKA